MANIRLIKRRIKSATNIAQITRAMEMVAASRMRRAQLQAISGKAYAMKIYEMVLRLAPRVDPGNHPLLGTPASISGHRLIITISTNKGLCGGLNTNLFRFMGREYSDLGRERHIVVGKKAASFVSRITTPESILADFSEEVPFVRTVPAITAMITKSFIGGECDAVDIVYNEFISALRQNPRKKTILPLTLEGVIHEDDAFQTHDILIEPDPETVFASLLPHYLENQIRDALLQAEASEHSARMIAMRSATDNAKALMEDLTLVYNKARQERITYEITDMVTARLVVEQ